MSKSRNVGIITFLVFCCLLLFVNFTRGAGDFGGDIDVPSAPGWETPTSAKSTDKTTPTDTTGEKSAVQISREDIIYDNLMKYDKYLSETFKESRPVQMLRKRATVLYIMITSVEDDLRTGYKAAVNGFDKLFEYYFYKEIDSVLESHRLNLKKAYDKATKSGTSYKDRVTLFKKAVSKIMYKDISGKEFFPKENEKQIAKRGFSRDNLFSLWDNYNLAIYEMEKRNLIVGDEWDPLPTAPSIPPKHLVVPDNYLFVQIVYPMAIKYPRPVPYEKYSEKIELGEKPDYTKLKRESADRIKQQEKWHSEQRGEQAERFNQEQDKARLSGASSSEMSSLAVEQSKAMVESEAYRRLADERIKSMEEMRVRLHQQIDTNLTRERGDEFRQKLWGENLVFFQGKLKDIQGGKITGSERVGIILEIQNFVSEGVPDYYVISAKNNRAELDKLWDGIRLQARQLEKSRQWIPTDLAYRWAIDFEKCYLPKNELNKKRYAKILNCILNYDPNAVYATVEAAKFMPAPNFSNVKYESKDDVIRFTGLTKNATIRVYKDPGASNPILVRTIKPGIPENTGTTGFAEWDKRDDNGNLVEANVYHFVFSNPEGYNKESGTIYIQ